MTDVHFACTACGRCCHDLKLRLSLAEASAWLADGNPVQILLDAVPWVQAVGGPLLSSPEFERKRLRSFAARSGRIPCQVEVTLTSAYQGACPNLQADMRCGIYLRRPNICRIYPADPLGARVLLSAHRLCPPEAWQPGPKPLIQGGVLQDAQTQAAIDQLNQAAQDDVTHKMRLCAALNLSRAAFASEGFVIYSPTIEQLRAALSLAQNPSQPLATDLEWTFVTPGANTVQALTTMGARAQPADPAQNGPWSYVNFQDLATA